MQRDTLSPTRTKRPRLKSSKLLASTRKDAKIMTTVLVSYNPNRIARSLKVLRVS